MDKKEEKSKIKAFLYKPETIEWLSRLTLLLVLVGVIMLMLLTTSCNKQVVDFTQKFSKVHIYETDTCYEVESWKDYDGEQLQIKIEGYGTVLTSSVNCMLVRDRCPICEGGN